MECKATVIPRRRFVKYIVTGAAALGMSRSALALFAAQRSGNTNLSEVADITSESVADIRSK